jgi:selenocysteine-specific elongation factor
MVAAGKLASESGAVRLPEHSFSLDASGERLWARMAPLLSDEARFRPPRTGEIAERLGSSEAEVRRVLKALARRRELVEVAQDHFFLRRTVVEMAGVAAEVAQAQAGGLFAAAQLRDRLGNGRKVCIQVLEFFDRQGVTLRRGDLRRIDAQRLDLFTRGPDAAAAAEA